MFSDSKNYKKQGEIGLGRAIAWFVEHGYTVCLPLTDSDAYDLVVEKDDVLSRVQVKTTSFKKDNGVYIVALKTSGGNQREYWAKLFDPKKVEILVALTEQGALYVIPCSEIEATSSLSLGKKYEEYKVQWVSG